MTIIRAEIRRWRVNANAVTGKIYKDSADVYDDGEDITILSIKDVKETSTFYLIQTDHGIYKLEKDERG